MTFFAGGRVIACSLRGTVSLVALLGLLGVTAALFAGVASANTAPDTPDSPNVTAGEQSLNVSWTAPGDGGSAITGYGVGYCDDTNNNCSTSDHSDWKTHPHSGTGTSTTISGLTNDTDYYVRVRATNANGTSAWSDTSWGRPTDLPGKPTSVSVTAGNTQLTVSWTAPSDKGGTSISYYDLVYCSSNCSDNSNWYSESTSDASTSYTITGLENGTTYQVRVRAVDYEQDTGPWTSSVNGTPSTTPQAPESPTVTVGERSLKVSWSAPTDTGGSAITGYDVQYSSDSGSNWTSHSHSGTSTKTTISNLTNGTYYEVQVRAKNANGNSSWSGSSSGTPTDLPGAPTSVSVTAGDSKLTVSWTAPTDKGGTNNTINHYQLRYCSETCSNWDESNQTGDGTTTSYEITGLTNGTTYQVQVRAQDSDGDDGPWTTSTNGKPFGKPDDPSEPTLTAGNKQIQVSWTAPNNNGGTITDYDVQYSTDDSTWTDAQHSGSSRSKTITGLTNGTNYYVQVRATNSAGSSGWSSSSQATPDVAPGQPAAPTVTIGDSQLSVSWTQPSNSGSAITGYDVHYKKTSASDWTDTYHGSTSTSTSISGLENGTSYQVRVRAYNANVTGAWSNSTSGTPDILPSAPDAPTLTRGNGSLSVSWSEPSNSGSAITGYVVRRCSGSSCDSDSDTTWTTKNISGRNTTSTTLGSLTNGTEYSVQVAAKNSAGTGSFSGSTTGTPATTPSTPGAPTLMRGDRSLSVSWTAPNNGGSAISGYDIGYCTGTCSNANDWTLEEDETGTTATIDNLLNGTAYKVRVRATNDVGDSSWSSQTTATPNAVPGKPAKPTLTVKDRKLDVSWTAPSNNGTAITGFKVGRCSSDCSKDTATWTVSSVSGGSTTKTTLSNLTNGTEYSVRVAAVNSAGTGSWSDAQKATPNTTPSKPSAPTVGRANASLSVSWSAPTNYGTAITGYDVRHCDSSKDCTKAANWTTKSVGATPTSATISSLTNGKTYKVEVRAKNTFGNSAWSTSTNGTPSTTPGQPNMGAVTNGDDQVTVTWDAPSDNGGSAITDYDVRYCTSDGESPAACVGDWTIWKPSQTSTTRSATITGLTNGTEYLLAARAANVAGEGSWSSHTWGEPDVVPGKPKSLAVASGDKQIIVTWSAADTDGSAITGYDLGTCSGTCANDSDWSVNILSNVYTWTVKKHPKGGADLVNGTTYKVRVAAVNDHGTGPWTAVVSGKAGKRPSAPSAPTVTAGNRQLSVSWSAPSDSGTGAVSDYDVQYKKSSDSTWTEWNASNTSTTTSATITDLTNDTQYDVQVRAQSEYGEGPWSATTTGTPDTPPGAPGAPTLTRGNTQLSVSWSAPGTNNGSAITDYDVRYCSTNCTNSNAVWTEWNSSDTSTTRQATITGLTNGTEYYVQVRAENAAGNGSWSSSRKGTPATKPSAPSPTVSAGHRQLTVTWSAPNDGGDAISDYDVQYKKSTVNTWTSHSFTGTGTTTTITGLTNGTTYHVQVQATNSVGDSAWSSSVSGKPDQVPRKPNKPTLERGNAQLSVSWSAPNNNGTAISDYDVQFKKSTDDDWTSHSFTGTGTTTTISSLDNGTEYHVQVRAENDAGDGAWSDSGKATPSTVPSAPGAPTLTAGDDRIAVNWSEPSNGGASITDYDVRYCSSNCSENTAVWTELNPNNTSTNKSTTITNLTNGTTYYVQVRAGNVAGDSDWSSSSSAMPNVVPKKPAKPTLERGNKQLLVSWTEPGNDGTAITDYDVRYCSSSCSNQSSWTEWNSDNTSTTTSATITELTNGTSYQVQVRAQNAAGNGPWSSSRSATPNVKPQKPSAPTVVRGNKSLSVSWDEPDNDGSAITDYDVQYKKTSDSTWTEWRASSTSTSKSATITGLENGTEYQVQVSAQNAAGNSPWSSSSTGTPATKPTTPAKPTLTMGDKSLVVTWTEPANGGNDITDYDVQYKKTSVSNYTEWNASDDSTTLTATITGLVNGADYHVRVRATNDVGDSNWSQSKTGSPNVLPGKPAKPTLTRKDRSLGVSWSAPTNTGSALTGFTVRHCSTNCTESTAVWTEKSISSGSTTSTTIGSLTNGTEYHVQVRARNKGGNGAWSDSAKETPNVAPAKPSTPSVTRGNTQLEVSWNEPSNNGTEITDYDVRYCDNSDDCSDDDNWTEWDSGTTSTTRSATITGLTNGTTYQVQVRAENAAGESQWSSSRNGTPATTPSAPSPTVGAGNRQLVVSWLEPDGGGDDISDYDVQYKKSTVNTWTSHSFSGTGTTTTITGLTNGTTYHVQVRAGNSVGESDWSASGSGTPDTLPGQPSAPTVSRGVEQLSVSWTEPSNSGSAITDYDVQYRKATDDDWTTHSFTGTGTSTTISSLDNGAEYHVQVRAENDKGEGAWSPSGTGTPSTTPDAPSAPTLTAGHRTLSVSWSAPDDNGGAPITDYDVQYKTSTDSGWTDAPHSGTGTSKTIGSLTNGTSYQVRVRATNVAGDSAWSSSATATPDTLPGTPSAPTVTRAHQSLSVTWTKPSNSGSAITGFKVGHCSSSCGSASNWTSKTVSGGSATTTTISGLTNGTSYQVKVRATNALGDGPWSNTRSGTPSTVPSKPTISKTTMSSRTINVTWDAPTNGGAAITDYDVQYPDDDGATWTSRAHTGTGRSTSITGLTNGTEYEIQVRATNVAGSSAWSDSATETPDVLPNRPGKPQLLVGETSLMVTWSPPINSGSAITSYDVQYKKTADSTWTQWNTTDKCNPSDTSTEPCAMLKSLTTDIEYEVQVRATNGLGPTAWSDSAKGTLTEPPDEPASVTTTPYKAALGVSWAAVEGATGYEVQYREQSGQGGSQGAAQSAAASAQTQASDWTTWPHSGTDTKTTIRNLENDKTYDVRVRATNENTLEPQWKQPPSDQDAQRTPSENSPDPDAPPPPAFFFPPAPGQPSPPTLAVGATSLMVSWTAPSTSGAAISGYDVQYKASSDSAWTDAQHSGTTTNRTITGLTTGTEYEVRVRASYNGGNGSWSKTTSATPVAPLAAPTKVEATPYLSALTVGWTTVADASGYEVQYSSDSGNTWTTWSHAGTGLGVAITGLSNDTTYEVRVRAVNANTLDSDDFNWTTSSSSESQRTPLEGLPEIDVEEIGPQTQRGNITVLPDRQRWGVFWFPVFADSCARDEPSWIQPAWVIEPDPSACGVLYVSGAVRDGLEEPADDLAVAAHAAVITEPLNDLVIDASAPPGYEQNGAILDLDLWAIHSDPEQESQTVTPLLGEIPPPALLCLPHDAEAKSKVAIGQWLQEDSPSGERVGGWRILAPHFLLDQEHVCAFVNRLSYFAVFRER